MFSSISYKPLCQAFISSFVIFLIPNVLAWQFLTRVVFVYCKFNPLSPQIRTDRYHLSNTSYNCKTEERSL